MLAIFTKWIQNGQNFTYRDQTTKVVGSDSEAVYNALEGVQKPSSTGGDFLGIKGQMDLKDCNLVHSCLLAGGLEDKQADFILKSLTMINAFKVEKNVPQSILILNKNINFEKGVNKILKMLCALGESPVQVVSFLDQNIVPGLLTGTNLISLLNFLTKSANPDQEET